MRRELWTQRPGTAVEKVVNVHVEPARPDTAFLSARARRLYAWWRRAADGGVPAKRAFDIVDHFPLAPYLYLAERRDDGTFRYRVRGGAILDMLAGRDGAPDHGAFGADAFPLSAPGYLARVLAAKRPLHGRGEVAFADGGVADVESIDCPLLDEPDGVPRYVLGLIDVKAPAPAPGAGHAGLAAGPENR